MEGGKIGCRHNVKQEMDMISIIDISDIPVLPAVHLCPLHIAVR